MLGLIFFFNSLNDFCVEVVLHGKAYLILVDQKFLTVETLLLFVSVRLTCQKKRMNYEFYSQFLRYKCRVIKVIPVQLL